MHQIRSGERQSSAAGLELGELRLVGVWHEALGSPGEAGWDAELHFRQPQLSYLAVRKLVNLSVSRS